MSGLVSPVVLNIGEVQLLQRHNQMVLPPLEYSSHNLDNLFQLRKFQQSALLHSPRNHMGIHYRGFTWDVFIFIFIFKFLLWLVELAFILFYFYFFNKWIVQTATLHPIASNRWIWCEEHLVGLITLPQMKRFETCRLLSFITLSIRHVKVFWVLQEWGYNLYAFISRAKVKT